MKFLIIFGLLVGSLAAPMAIRGKGSPKLGWEHYELKCFDRIGVGEIIAREEDLACYPYMYTCPTAEEAP